MARYVILKHDQPFLHWDFMLQDGGRLRTWRLAAPPQPGHSVAATPSFDHRLIYLEYEGQLSGNRGTVTRWDMGTFDWQANEPRRVIVRLAGGQLRGLVCLEEAPSGEWALTMAALGDDG